MRLRAIHPLDGLAAVLHRIRPDWPIELIHAVLLNDDRADEVAYPAALHCALNRDMRHPNALRTYAVRPTVERTPDLRAPRCPHGTLADPDGRGADCHGCGTRAVPPSPDVLAQLRAAATAPTRHTPTEDA